MTQKDPIVFIKHIVESIEIIEEYCSDLSRHDFKQNRQVQDAVIRRLEIIGEAGKNIPVSFRDKYPTVPWRKMIGTRDKLTHQYFGVDLNLAFDIVTDDLPSLKEQLHAVLDSEEKAISKRSKRVA